MVAIMAATPEKTVRLIKSAKSAADIPSKLRHLHRLNADISDAKSSFISSILPLLIDLAPDRFSPVRKYIIRMIGHIGLKHVQFLPEIVPVLITLLKDDTPAVARQVIASAIDIFRCTLIKVSLQGMLSSELEGSLQSSWSWVQKLRDEIYAMAFQVARDGRRLLALKFVISVVLLYAPDPNGSPEPTFDMNFETQDSSKEFNISWIRGGHPLLNVGDLAIEASRTLGLLLDQLRLPTVKSLSNLMIIVLVKGLSTIATRRPSFYGRILPVLLGLDRSSSSGKGVHYALKNAFLCCLNCSHSGAAPWRDRLVVALEEINNGPLVDKAQDIISQEEVGTELNNVSPLIQVKVEVPSAEVLDDAHSGGRKRTVSQDNNELTDNKMPGKRLRPTPSATDTSLKETRTPDSVSPGRLMASRSVEDNGPAQQLVTMFGALVAQGEKAVGSLEILISSISADLLAEVVMTIMRNLPPNCPKTEDDEEMLLKFGMVGSENQFKHLSSLLTDILPVCNSSLQKDATLDTLHTCSIEPETSEPAEEEEDMFIDQEIEQDEDSPGVSILPSMPSEAKDGPSGLLLEVNTVSSVDNEIPGLDMAGQDDGLQEIVSSSLQSANLGDLSQDQVMTSSRSLVESHPSMSTDRSEELSTIVEVTSASSSMATSLLAPRPLLLPKISAPVIDLTDKEKDQLQKFSFMRIIDAYKQVVVAGGSQLRISVLASLAVEFPLELDPWKLLQSHILEDYVNHEGHELTLRVLYKLFGEAEEDRDFFSSTTATSVYDMFLLIVAETLRDSFPASDKSFGRLLAEVPYLPKSILKLLESMCSPGSGNKDEKSLLSGDRVTQGLMTVWNLTLMRPPVRDACLKIALQSAVHHLEEVRMKAIRLVANKLYPLPYISQQIEEFAKEELASVANINSTTDLNAAVGTDTDTKKDGNSGIPSNDHPMTNFVTKESSDAQQSSSSESISSSLIAEALRCMSLYFALCTKKRALVRQIFVMFKSTPKPVKQAFHRQIPLLVRTIGSSTELLGIISDPPNGCEDLLIQVLHTLTDGAVPSPALVSSIKKLYDTAFKDVDILILILPFLPKEEVLAIFPQLVNAPMEKFQISLSRVLQGVSDSGPVLTPAEALIAIHGIDPEKDGIPLKKVTDACNACFEQRQIFTQQVLAKVLNQLVEQIPLPLLFMRTVLQAIGAFPTLVDFIMDILSRLVSKQIWKYPKLWVGFVKCALLTKPQSFSVLLQLPPQQLENALNRTPGLKAPLAAHASQPNITTSLPRSVLVVLGIASESENSSQAQPTADVGARQAQPTADVGARQAQPTADVEACQAQPTPDEAQPSDVGAHETQPSEDVGVSENSDKESMTEKSKDSTSAS
ncbi:hypothetical protein LIER_08109 [Lithospermum erythrorhizon]|uniref:Symplekin n=1 Tax=Lithospermum erythrorhizon TaxID=34254 RepID=A0AAV3PBT0_LITER